MALDGLHLFKFGDANLSVVKYSSIIGKWCIYAYCGCNMILAFCVSAS